VAPGTQRDLWTLSLASPDPVPEIYLATPDHEAWARFSPDGEWVAYQSDASGLYEIYLDTFPKPSERVIISIGGGVYPQWRGDGRELFYIDPAGTLVAVDLTTARGGALQAALFYLVLAMGLATLFRSEAAGAMAVAAVLGLNGLITGFGANPIRASPFWNPHALPDADATELLAWTLQNRIGIVLAMAAIVALTFMRANRRETMLGA
jgi:hypothetical protein